VCPIHPDDIAAVAVKALTESGHEGQMYALTGSQLLSYGEMAAAIGRAIGRSITHQSISVDALREVMVQGGMPEPVASSLAWYQSRIAAGDPLPTTRSTDVERVLGRPPLDFDAWVSSHAAAFRE
jgi:uncharacterized protein YbjT (DUF2867 family)